MNLNCFFFFFFFKKSETTTRLQKNKICLQKTYNFNGVCLAVDLCFDNVSVQSGSNHVDEFDRWFPVSARVEVGQTRAVNIRKRGSRHDCLQD